ncbi:MAG: ribokinase [Paracoccaceae bacterium]|nr:ribokinase [Paracoccaceae bacterium]
MSIFNLGSINIDHVYRVTALPGPGETVSDKGYASGLGGKGVNQSLAAAAAGARVLHIGATGADGRWIAERLRQAGIGTDHLAEIDGATGHAVVCVDDAGENQIVIHGGANRALTEAQIADALRTANEGDWFLAQNETNLVASGFAMARAAGLRKAYSAAPFDPEMTAQLVDNVDLLAVNQIEAAQLADHLGVAPECLPVPELLITMGAQGARYQAGGEVHQVAAFAVETMDTTGAGDTFLGAFLAARDQGEAPHAALRRAAAMAAIQVTRTGAADAIPTGAEVRAFLAEKDR